MPPAPPGPAGATPAGNLADLVRDAARARPEHPALVAGAAGDQRLSWAEVDAAVDAVAAGLTAAGVAVGERVALLLPNDLAFPVAWFGVLRAGAVAVPLNPLAPEPELQARLADAGVVAAFVTTDAPGALDATAGLPPERRQLVGPGPLAAGSLLVTGVTAEAAAGRGALPARAGGEDLAVLLYTAGTMGRPHGAMLTHRALLANVEQVGALAEPAVTPDDVVLLVLPLFHVFGLNGVLGQVARAAATAVLVERFDPAATLDLVRRAGVTNIAGAPAMYLAWASQPGFGAAMSGVRLLVTGAAPMPAAVLEEITTLTGVPVHEGYGLTEAAPGLTSTLASGRPKPGTVGRPLPGVELRLVDDAGQPVEEGDPGEVLVRGANLFSGYWPDGHGGPDADGWYATGDLGLLDGDGDLVLVGREKDVIIVNGFNVYPREVEEAVASLPGVAEVGVVGVPHPQTGEAVKAYVVPLPGVEVTAEAVVAHVARRLSRFKCPTIVAVVDGLPLSATGKVAKGVLREAAARTADDLTA